uniref:Uncharacterized protein n=1 Tax=Meloidogyne enterolobii TaxID=390850 RepID=A0A6V7XAI3_MELEN|nr:unnamed protein product [Meloidogyne enterolobii]
MWCTVTCNGELQSVSSKIVFLHWYFEKFCIFWSIDRYFFRILPKIIKIFGSTLELYTSSLDFFEL